MAKDAVISHSVFCHGSADTVEALATARVDDLIDLCEPL